MWCCCMCVVVVLDKREKRHADTGCFELAFKDSTMSAPKCVDQKFLIEGQRIRRLDLAKYSQIDDSETRKEESLKTKAQLPKVRTNAMT